MMKLITDNFEKHKQDIFEAIKRGEILIYPTDTIYGIGCDATNEKSVKKIRKIKDREEKPFLVIAPDKKWIRENCVVGSGKDLNKLPGPYSLIYKLKNPSAIANGVNSTGNLGVRIPDHWIAGWVREMGIPFVTTSVNLSGIKHMENLDDVDPKILKQVDLVLYEGERKGESSTKIDLSHL